MKVNFSKFDNSWYKPGRGIIVQITWFVVNAAFLQNPLILSSKLKVGLLRLFGAKIGKCVVLKPSINVKYPWNIEIGDYSWIGEKTWLDSLGKIKIGQNVCISQGTYLCTGNHDWNDPAFGLIVKHIIIEDGVWIGAKSVVLPGVTMGNHSIATAGSIVSADTKTNMIYAGNPAIIVKERRLSPD